MDWSAAIKIVADVVDFLGDLTTVLVGVATLVAFFRYKSKIGAVIRLLRINHINERVSVIRKTLDLILEAEIPKGKAPNLRSLFARLNGQLLPFCALVPELKDLQSKVASIAHGSGQLNDPIRQQIAHEIMAQIESSKLMSLNDIVGSR